MCFGGKGKSGKKEKGEQEKDVRLEIPETGEIIHVAKAKNRQFTQAGDALKKKGKFRRTVTKFLFGKVDFSEDESDEDVGGGAPGPVDGAPASPQAKHAKPAKAQNKGLAKVRPRPKAKE